MAPLRAIEPAIRYHRRGCTGAGGYGLCRGESRRQRRKRALDQPSAGGGWRASCAKDAPAAEDATAAEPQASRRRSTRHKHKAV